MYTYHLTIVLAPLAAAIIAGLFGKQIGRAASHWITILAVGVSFVLSALILKDLYWDGGQVENYTVYTWAIADGLRMEVGFLIDRLTALMMVVVTFVSLMVHVYSISAVAGLFGKQIGRAASHWITILAVGLSFVLSALVLKDLYWDGGQIENYTVYTWAIADGLRMEVGFLIDRLTALMMVVVTFVSLMVHVYTIGYMADDDGYQRFFSYISLFTFSMLMLVMSNNFLQLFFGWEVIRLLHTDCRCRGGGDRPCHFGCAVQKPALHQCAGAGYDERLGAGRCTPII